MSLASNLRSLEQNQQNEPTGVRKSRDNKAESRN